MGGERLGCFVLNKMKGPMLLDTGDSDVLGHWTRAEL